jgi:hypothetical protein
VKLLEAAKALRAAQRTYLADRGNEAKGRAVGDAAATLDRAIEEAEAARTTLGIRAAKLLGEMDAWFHAEQITPPPYVQRQVDQLRAALADTNGSSRAP